MDESYLLDHNDYLSFSVHHPGASITREDANNFGRHINLHLTYSFQSQQNAKSPVFVPRRKFKKHIQLNGVT